jgi:glycosyltransferase involved in cell wall biosynthesis
MIATAMSTLNTKSRKKNPAEAGAAAGDGVSVGFGSPVWLVIPAYNEADVIEQTLLRLPSGIFSQVVVADNGSNDKTAEIAKSAGATVVSISEKGYGAACLAALDQAPDDAILVYLQADGSEDAAETSFLIEPILNNTADLVIGSRVLGQASKGALRSHQRFGNWLATRLIGLFWGQHLTDLGPFRAIRAGQLRKLGMRDRNYGWTVEMQVLAAQQKLRVTEIPVRYGLRLAGEEKVSGNLNASFRAGTKILWVIFRSLVPK